MTGSLFSFLQYLNSPLFGAASDRYGRKPMVLLSLMGSAISYAVWGLSTSFEVFLIARIIGGLSEANISISTALIADLPSATDRSKGMVSYKPYVEIKIFEERDVFERVMLEAALFVTLTGAL